MASPAQTKAVTKYIKEHTRRFTIQLNRKTDADMIAHLESAGNVTGYMKALVAKDMKARNSIDAGKEEARAEEWEEENEASSKEFEEKLRTERTLLEDVKELGVSEAAERKIDRRIRDIEETLGR